MLKTKVMTFKPKNGFYGSGYTDDQITEKINDFCEKHNVINISSQVFHACGSDDCDKVMFILIYRE